MHRFLAPQALFVPVFVFLNSFASRLALAVRTATLLLLILVLPPTASIAASPACSLIEARKALSSEGLGSQPEPAKPEQVLCADFARFGVMIDLEGTPPYDGWTVYQKGRGWLGIETRPVVWNPRRPSKTQKGASVSGVQTNSPAAKAGIEHGDKILSFN